MYRSSYWPPNPISTVQSEDPHVMDHLSKFHLNRTVNEPENLVLWKLRKPEKWWRLTPRSEDVAPGGTELAPCGSCSAKNTKNSIFRESEHHTSLLWHLAANWMPPGGSCSSRNPDIPLAPMNLNHSYCHIAWQYIAHRQADHSFLEFPKLLLALRELNSQIPKLSRNAFLHQLPYSNWLAFILCHW